MNDEMRIHCETFEQLKTAIACMQKPVLYDHVKTGYSFAGVEAMGNGYDLVFYAAEETDNV